MKEIFLHKGEDSSVTMMVASHFGLMPMIYFPDWDNYLKFIKGLEDFRRENESQEIPETILKAFEEE